VNLIVGDTLLFGSAAILLILLNAIFVGSEFSLIRLRYSHFNPDLLDKLRKTKRFAKILDRVDEALQFLRLGISLSTLVLGVVLVPLVSSLLTYLGIDTGGVWAGFVYVACLVVAIGLNYVLGESVPRGVALQHPVGMLHASYWLIWLLRTLTFPFMKLFGWFSRQSLRMFHLDPHADLNKLDLETQILSMDEDSSIPAFTQRVFKNVISMRELVVHDVMLPRNQIQFFDIFDGNEFNLELSKKAGHTRYPLCEGDMDNCLGIVHIKDVYRSEMEVQRLEFKKLARPVIVVGPDDSLELVLEQLLDKRLHMALVRDEFGGTVGVVTMENIVEQLVGNIQDEFDSEAEQIEEVQEDVFIVDGLTPIHDVEEILNIEIDEDEVSTLGGLLTSELGKIPDAGQKVRLQNLEIEAMEVDEKRVLSARVRVLHNTDD
tara:strand:+ start:5689 stop:6984 length:1296 start_codon:yes stop_codon:yes gene_type:complete